MSRSPAVLQRLAGSTDWLSPIVVKEIRQIVRGREFNYSFGASLAAGLAVAFFGAADALTGNGTSGSWTFMALMGCLGFLGLAVVPLAAFSALRNERMEQTLELITLTALSPRRIVVGKLLAQAVKLVTLFAATAPFIAMSFLLGGIDFVTILVSLLVLFMWSLWACALCLFLSTLLKSRAMSGLVFGAVGIALFLAVVGGRSVFFMMRAGVGGFSVAPSGSGSGSWWALAITTTFCLASMVNLVLLAENRLSLPTEDRVTRLRVGFLLQFLLIAAWILSFLQSSPRVQGDALDALGVFGGLHLAVVAMFAVTEDLVVSRRVLIRLKARSAWSWLLAMFRPGGGRGAAYVLAQMALLILTARLFHPGPVEIRWLLAICGYICFFSGVPTLAYRLWRPGRAASFELRVALLVLVPISMLLPDMIYYILWRPDVLDLGYSARHLINPVRTLANWGAVEGHQHWLLAPAVFGVTGVLAYLVLIRMGARLTAEPVATEPQDSEAVTREPGSANVVN